ncbi:MAG: hypothetical protein IT293_06560 [Deltaproteobacteria bacterium]|nr:hypothetical protein [Deltaproteobacteria bacterium]
MMRGRALLAAVVGCGLSLAIAAGAAARPDDGLPVYTVDAALDPAARTITGTVQVRVINTSAAPLADVALVLYPNRFATPDPAIDDINRPFVYPREVFVAGGVTLDGLESAPTATPDAAWTPLGAGRLEAIGRFDGTLLRVALPEPLPPGAAVAVRARFTTVMPERYGVFGVADGRVTALDGWFPMLPALAADGRWDPTVPTRPPGVRGRLRAPTSYQVLIGETLGPEPPAESFDFDVPAGSPPTLFAAEDFAPHGRDVDHAIVGYFELPARRAFELWPGQARHARVLDAVERILRERPAGVPLPRKAIVLVEAPLRLELTAPGGPSLAIVSDRTLRVHRLLRDFHERELAQALYAAILWDAIARREAPADAPWVVEGVSAALADRWLAAAHPAHRTVYDWIGLFNVFAIVDRFESAPKLPFAGTFFPEERHASVLRDDRESLGRDRPPGRTVFTKLRNEIGIPAFDRALDAYLADPQGGTFRAAAATAAGRSEDRVFVDWTAPYPEPLDYALADVELNAPGAPGTSASAASGDREDWAQRFSVLRESSRPVREVVEVEVRGRGGDERARLTWNGDGARADLSIATPWRARRVVLDPDRKLLEDERVNDAVPGFPQVVLDSADVTVTSSQFGLSGLFVARRRYDYTKDLGLVAYFSDRSVGVHVGPRLHFGPRNDATTYRHNLYGYYTFEALRGDFRDDSRRGRGDDGVLAGLGLRYDYTDEYAWDNPTDQTKVRLFGDWFASGLGSSYDYVDWGVRVSTVKPIFTPRTLFALQLMNAWSAPIDSRVPNQGRYALGGDLGVRAVPVDERLGENIALARFELRQTIYPEVDHNFFDWVTFRHGQLRLFLDAGRVEDRRTALYRPSDFALGVGVGVAGMYDFMGFFPSVAYLAVAQRIDDVDASGVQFLFGTRQAF